MIFNEGDFVMLCIKKRRLKSVETNPVVKLAPRFYGPFRVTAKTNDLAYRLDLPCKGARNTPSSSTRHSSRTSNTEGE